MLATVVESWGWKATEVNLSGAYCYAKSTFHGLQCGHDWATLRKNLKKARQTLCVHFQVLCEVGCAFRNRAVA